METQQGKTLRARLTLPPALPRAFTKSVFPGQTWGDLWCSEGLLLKDV